MTLKMKQRVFSALVLTAIFFAAGACTKVQDASILQLKSISATSLFRFFSKALASAGST